MQVSHPTVAPSATVVKSIAYGLISAFYGDRVAERSRVPLIHHVNEGLVILERIGASWTAAEAFCLHPLLQSDLDLPQHYLRVCREGIDKHTILLAMEYRNIANAFLSDKVILGPDDMGRDSVYTTAPLRLSPLSDVNDMLIADKVQNRKDFLRYHKGTHARSVELDHYFNVWLEALGISEERYTELVQGL